MANTVPVQFFAGVYQSVVVAEVNPSAQLPQPLLVKVPGSVGLYVTLYVELLIESGYYTEDDLK